MTMRGLVFGNSHVAALRLAQRQSGGQWPQIALDFAACAGDGMATLRVENGVLASVAPKVRDNLFTLNGRSSFDLRDYAFFLICGGTPSMFHAVHLYRDAGIHGFGSMAKDGGRTLMSRAAFQATLAGVMQAGMGVVLAKGLAVMGKPCFVAAHPRVSIAARADMQTFAGFFNVCKYGDAERLATLFDASVMDACAGHAMYLPQPRQTIADHIFTAEAFRRGAVRLTPGDDVPQPANDYLHANGAYGALLIDALCKALAAPAIPMKDGR